jgi:hypothetical protein
MVRSCSRCGAGRGAGPTTCRMRRIATTFALLAVLVSGCSTNTLSKDECLTVDWRTVGYEDGVAGYNGDRIGQHRKACAEYGVTPDFEAYQAGRAEGLREYCQPQNGFRVGASGATYVGACPADLAPPFAVAYESGRELYVRQHRVNNANSQLAAKRRDIERIEHRMTSTGFAVIDPQASPEQRAQALLETTQLAERHGRLASEIEQLEKDKLRWERELDEYRNEVAYAR